MAKSTNFNESMVRLTRHGISCVFKAKCTCCMNNLMEMVDVFAFKGSHDESSSSDEEDKNQR